MPNLPVKLPELNSIKKTLQNHRISKFVEEIIPEGLSVDNVTQILGEKIVDCI
jgi:hypothetical protein